MTPAEELTAAADLLGAIPDDELRICLGVDGQPCGADPILSRDAIRALVALLRQVAEARRRCGDIRSASNEQALNLVIPGYAEALDLARAILATKEGT